MSELENGSSIPTKVDKQRKDKVTIVVIRRRPVEMQLGKCGPIGENEAEAQ